MLGFDLVRREFGVKGGGKKKSHFSPRSLLGGREWLAPIAALSPK